MNISASSAASRDSRNARATHGRGTDGRRASPSTAGGSRSWHISSADIPTFEKTDADRTREHALRDDWIAALPPPYDAELRALFAEMDACETKEARLVRALDRMEAVLTHNEGDPGTWLPLEYDLQRTYGVPEAAFSDVLADIRAAVNCEVDALIAAQAASNKQKEQDK